MNIFKHKVLTRGLPGLTMPIVLAALLLCGANTASAQSADKDRFSLSLGVFLTNRDTITQIDGETAISGTPVDLENDLGFNKSDSVFRIDGYYKFAERSRFDFSAFDLSRTGSKQLDKDIEWNGEVYPVDVLVNAKLDLAIYKLAYTWAFMQRENGYVGASAGFYVADIGTSIAAESLARSSSSGLTAPLPVVGLRGQYDFSERWSLRGSAEVFAVDYDAYSGSLNDLYVSLDYQFAEHAAVGVGFNSVRLDIAVDKSGFNGDLNWRYDGGLLFLKFDF